MSTKATIQNLINNNLADFSDIIPSEHREVENALLSELYPTTITEYYNGLSNTLVITNFLVANILYKLNFTKSGNRVLVTGTIKNNTANIFTGDFLEIISAEYLQKTSSKQYANAEGTYLSLFNDKLKLTNIGVGQTLHINFSYITND